MSDFGDIPTESTSADFPPPVTTETAVDEVPTAVEATQEQPASVVDDHTGTNTTAASDTGTNQNAPDQDAGTDDQRDVSDQPDIDLDAIERDLTDVQTALDRLNDGSYWTDEVTGEAIPDDVVAAFPLTRTVSGNTAN